MALERMNQGRISEQSYVYRKLVFLLNGIERFQYIQTAADHGSKIVIRRAGNAEYIKCHFRAFQMHWVLRRIYNMEFRALQMPWLKASVFLVIRMSESSKILKTSFRLCHGLYSTGKKELKGR